MTQMTKKSQSIAQSHSAVIFAADQPATMARLARNGCASTRKAAELLAQIAEMHRRSDYNHAMEHQIAENALFYLPMSEIELLCAAYERARG